MEKIIFEFRNFSLVEFILLFVFLLTPLFLHAEGKNEKEEDTLNQILIRSQKLKDKINDIDDEIKSLRDKTTKMSVFDSLPVREKEKLLFTTPSPITDSDSESRKDPLRDIKKNPAFNWGLNEMILENNKSLKKVKVGMTPVQVQKVMSKRFEFTGKKRDRVITNPCKIEKFHRAGNQYKTYYYLIQWSSPMYSRFIKITDTTPLIFKNNRFIGQGWDFWSKITGQDAKTGNL